MPIQSTAENLIHVRETSLAIEGLLIADSGITFSPTRVDVSSPPAGFFYAGCVVEDTPQLQTTREKYTLQTGIPRVRQYEAIRGIDGTFSVTFYSNANRLARFSAAGVKQVKTIIGSFGNAVVITSIDNAKTRVFVGTIAAASFVIGDWLTAGINATDLTRGDNEGEIFGIGTAAGETPGWLSFTSPGFISNLTTSDKIAKVTMSRIPFGTKQLPTFHVIGVADFIDGVQVLHDFQKAVPAGDWTEQIRPDAAAQIATQWNLFGYTVAAALYGTPSAELVVGERFFFPKQ